MFLIYFDEYSRMWTLIYLIENELDKLPDIIPNVWIIDKNSCWYPKNLKSNVITSFAKKQMLPDHASEDWEFCNMNIVEDNISN